MKTANTEQVIVVAIILLATLTAVLDHQGSELTHRGISAASMWLMAALALSLFARRTPRTPNLTMALLLLIALCALISLYLIAASAEPLFSEQSTAQFGPLSPLLGSIEVSSLQ